GAVGPGAVDLGQRLALLGGARDRGRGGVGRRQRQHDCSRFRGGHFARSAGVARGLFHPELVARVAFDGHVFLFGGTRYGRAAGEGSFAVALPTRRSSDLGAVGPGAVDLGQRLAPASFTGDRGRGGVGRRQRLDHFRGGGGR